jgi:dipeptidyl aminopeptidase/acylaminoacyl peptidase
VDVIAALISALVLLGGAGAATADRPVAIPAAGGEVALAGTVTVLPGPGPHPAAVLVGGFGPANRDGSFGERDRDGGAYRAWAEALAERGLAVLRYDKRGVGESEGPALSWLDARPLAADVAAATRVLAGLPGVDPERVTLIGHSQGGDLALAAALVAPATRIVTLAAPGRPLGLLPRGTGAAGRFLQRLLGPGAASATLRRDPLRDAARARQPALLVHGTADRTVPVEDMSALAAARERAGRSTRTLTVPGAGHFVSVDGRVPEGALDAIAWFARAA